MPDLRVATYNVYAKLPAREAAQDLRDLMPISDVVGFQEFGSQEDRRQLNAVRGFRVARGRDVSTPIAWRTSEFKYLDSDSEFLSDATDVGHAGAGPRVLKRKDALWVKLKHRDSRRVFVFINSHLAPSIYLDERRDLHIQQTDNLAKLIRRFRRYNVVLLGDYNVDFKSVKARRDPEMPVTKFGKLGVVASYAVLGTKVLGTHGRRLIDYVWYKRRDRRLKAIEQRVLRGFGSDHKPLWVRFRVSKRWL